MSSFLVYVLALLVVLVMLAGLSIRIVQQWIEPGSVEGVLCRVG